MTDVIITGIPRAGTTLIASRIDAEPNSVCLNEPFWQYPDPTRDAGGFAELVAADFDRTRDKFLRGEAVTDRRGRHGEALTNYYADGTDFIDFPLTRPELTPGFTLAMKHNGPYLAVLPELLALGRFDVRAVIRKPLPVIRSWRRLQLPVSQGRMPNAAACWPALKAISEKPMPLLQKQVELYELMLTRILAYQSQLTLLRYEEFADPHDQKAAEPTSEDEMILAMLRHYAPEGWRYQAQDG